MKQDFKLIMENWRKFKKKAITEQGQEAADNDNDDAPPGVKTDEDKLAAQMAAHKKFDDDGSDESYQALRALLSEDELERLETTIEINDNTLWPSEFEDYVLEGGPADQPKEIKNPDEDPRNAGRTPIAADEDTPAKKTAGETPTKKTAGEAPTEKTAGETSTKTSTKTSTETPTEKTPTGGTGGTNNQPDPPPEDNPTNGKNVIAQIQQILVDAGFAPATQSRGPNSGQPFADGQFGPLTYKALLRARSNQKV